MTTLTWGPDLEVGFGDIDVQHRRLVDLINRLEQSVSEAESHENVSTILDEVVRYTRLHFVFEEKLMDRYSIEETEEHRAEHYDFTREVIDFRRRFRNGELKVGNELLQMLSGWLRNHILGTDVEFARELRARGAQSAVRGTQP